MTNTTQSELACEQLIDLINNATEENLPTILKSKEFKDLLGEITDSALVEVCAVLLGKATRKNLPEVIKGIKGTAR